MGALWRILAIGLVFTLVNYGVLAAAVTHAHEHSGPHAVHFLDDGDDRLHHGQEGPTGDEPNAPKHSESGFHTHSSPQFGPVDAATLRVAFAASSRIAWADPSGSGPLYKDKPAFKPPRTIL